MNDNVRYGVGAIVLGLAIALIAMAGQETIRGVGLLIALVGLASVGWGLVAKRD